jgi:hypothetical protein
LIQPGGAKLKQSDSVLNDFGKACESLPLNVMGSILINKLYDDIPWVSKAVIYQSNVIILLENHICY